MMPTHRETVSVAVIAVAVVLLGGMTDYLFETGVWIPGFCALAVTGALAYAQHSRKTPVFAPSTTDVVNGFVATARAKWTENLEERDVFEWHPLPIRWTTLHDDSEPNRAEDIAAFYQLVPARRLIILGRPGAGKTVLAIQLAQQLSQSGDEIDRVPVFISLSSWNPGKDRFVDWLKDRLATTYPSLSAVDATGRRIADALVDEHRILPVLDGLDEMGEQRQPTALAALGRLAPFPFVLTCRTEEYLASVGSGDTARPLRDVVAVQVEPLRPSDIRAYLGTDENGAPSPVLRHLAENPDGVLFRTLSTPLMCFLMKVAYTGSTNPPAELVALAEKSPAALEEHLLERFVPVLFGPGRSGPKRVRDWDASQATRWLSYLARNFVGSNERDLVPWNVRKVLTLPAAPLRIALSGVVSGCVIGAAVGVAGMLASGALGLSIRLLGVDAEPVVLISPPWAAVVAVLALVLLGGIRFAPDRVLLAWRASGTSGTKLVHYGLGAAVRLLIGAIGGVGILVLHTLHGTLGLVALVALAGGVIMGTVTRILSAWSGEWRSPRRIRVRARKIPDAVIYGLGGGLLTGLGSAVLVGSAAGMLVACGAVAVGVAVNLLDERTDLAEADRASSVLASDRWATSLQLASLGVVVGLFTQFAHPSGPVTTLVFGVGMGAGAGLALGVAAALFGGIPVMFPSTVWIRYLTAKWWLALGRHVPIRLLLFLDDACALGVMRRVGAVYQFRHIDFQRHLSRSATDS